MKDIKGKRLLLLGSSVWRDIIRQFAEDYGVELIFAGNSKCALDEIVSESYCVNSIDHIAMKKFIAEHNIDGVYMGGSELIISHACEYLNDINKPCYCTKAQWEILQDKANFKDLCIKHGLPVVPKYHININNIADSVPVDAYPVITKPTDGSGSNGFSICNNAEELIRGYKKAAEDSPTHSVICEKFVNNSGLVAFYSFTNGKMVYALTEDKYPVKYEKQGSYVAGLFLCESRFRDEFRMLYESKLEKLFKDINVKEGTIWIEVFHDGNNYYFNEVGYRYGGSYSFYSVDYFRSINQIYADLYYALTGDSQLEGFNSLIPKDIERGKNYCIYPIHINSGKISSFEGVEEIKSWNNIVFFPVSKNVGDNIEDTGSWGQCVALAHFTYDTMKECADTIERIHSVFKVINDKGINLVCRKLNFNSVIL